MFAHLYSAKIKENKVCSQLRSCVSLFPSNFQDFSTIMKDKSQLFMLDTREAIGSEGVKLNKELYLLFKAQAEKEQWRNAV